MGNLIASKKLTEFQKEKLYHEFHQFYGQFVLESFIIANQNFEFPPKFSSQILDSAIRPSVSQTDVDRTTASMIGHHNRFMFH